MILSIMIKILRRRSKAGRNNILEKLSQQKGRKDAFLGVRLVS